MTTEQSLATGSNVDRFDTWMHGHPWHPRVLPFLAYAIFLAIIPLARDVWAPSYPILYVVQCGLVLVLLFRYRHALPELTVEFHWLAVPVGVGVAAAWIALGLGMVELFPDAFADSGAEDFRQPDQLGYTLGWTMLVLRLLGMSLVVPLFEELFIRSLLLRSFSSFRQTAIGIVQIAQDFPILGEWLMNTRLAHRADRHPPIFGRQFHGTPLGAVTPFGILASTLIFASYHHPRDLPGCLVCGVAYCLLVAATNRRRHGHYRFGLGPVIWAHGITNALLWVYTVYTGDWQFL